MQTKRYKRLSLLGILLLLLMGTPISAQSVPRRFLGNSIATKLEVIDTSILSGDVTLEGGLILTPPTTVVVTMNGTVTPLAANQPISSTGTVNTSSITVGDAGSELTLINMAATSIVFSDTGTLKLTGNITLGQYDSLRLLSDGTNWIMLGTANN